MFSIHCHSIASFPSNVVESFQSCLLCSTMSFFCTDSFALSPTMLTTTCIFIPHPFHSWALYKLCLLNIHGEELFSSSSAGLNVFALHSKFEFQIPNIYICPGVNVQTIPKSPYFPYVCSQFDICLDFVLRESLSVTVFDSCYHSHHYAGPDFFETFWMQHSLNSFPSLSSYFQSFSSPPSTPTPPSISRLSSSPTPLSSTIIH